MRWGTDRRAKGRQRRRSERNKPRMEEMKGGKREGEHKGKAESEALISIPTAPESLASARSCLLTTHRDRSLFPSLFSLNSTHLVLESPLFPYDIFSVISGTSLILQVCWVGHRGAIFNCFPSVTPDHKERHIFPIHCHGHYPSFMSWIRPWPPDGGCACRLSL